MQGIIEGYNYKISLHQLPTGERGGDRSPAYSGINSAETRKLRDEVPRSGDSAKRKWEKGRGVYRSETATDRESERDKTVILNVNSA